MSPTLPLRIVSVIRERSYDGVSSVSIPTKDGYITVLPQHAPLVSALQPGVLTIRHTDGTSELFAVGGGVVETDGTTLTIIADIVEDSGEIDLADARSRHEHIRKEIDAYRSGHDTVDMGRLIEMEESYLHEIARMQVAEMHLNGK